MQLQAAEAELLGYGLDWFESRCPEQPGSAYSLSAVPVARLGHVHQARLTCPDRTETGPALVCLHGFGSGTGIWYAVLPGLRAIWPGPVLALDWYGCGQSSRPEWRLGHGRDCPSLEAVEEFFVRPLECWRAAVGIETMVLLGHSMGGYLAGCYGLRHPERVAQLVLVSPMGLSGPPVARGLEQRMWEWGINPLMALWHMSRLVGRAGLWLFFRKFREADWFDRGRLVEYHYQNALNGEVSGGRCITCLVASGMRAWRPLGARLAAEPALRNRVGFIYGDSDGFAEGGAEGRAHLERAPVRYVAGAGHDVIVDNPDGFVDVVANLLDEFL